MDTKDIVNKIRTGELDCNNQQLFFSKVIKGLMVDLRSFIKIRNIQVPHIIINTGDDTMWLLEKGYDFSKEPQDNTNEQYVYSMIPRCIVELGSMDMVPDQLTSPYARGNFQYEYDNQLLTLSAEFRRMPVKIQVTLKYVLDSFTDVLEMMQHICSKLAFVRTFNIVYMGQTITSSYKIPESFEDQHQVEITGDLNEPRYRTIELQIELESNLPVYSGPTVTETTYIAHPIQTLSNKNHEIAKRDYASRSGYRGSRFGTR